MWIFPFLDSSFLSAHAACKQNNHCFNTGFVQAPEVVPIYKSWLMFSTLLNHVLLPDKNAFHLSLSHLGPQYLA